MNRFLLVLLALSGCNMSTPPMKFNDEQMRTRIVQQSSGIALKDMIEAKHAALPIGTKVYASDNLVVSVGSKQSIFAGTASVKRTSFAIIVDDNARVFRFPPTAAITLTKGSYEQYVLPGASTPPSLVNSTPTLTISR